MPHIGPASHVLPLLLALGLTLSSAARAGGDNAAIAERGRQLFHGALPLSGQITGHTSPLPPQASRCVNCHAAGSAGAAAASASATRSFGPLLTPQGLTEPSRRRGGPPSRYDEAAFCRLLHTGVDPAYIIIPRAMPRYDLPDSDCHALWTYLSTAPR